MTDSEGPWYERRPQLLAYAATPVVLVLLGVALTAWLRARAIADVREADNQRALAFVALGFAALAALTGGIGYLLRRERRKLARDVAEHALSREAIVSALEHPPLQFAPSFRRQLNVAVGVVVAIGLVGLIIFGFAAGYVTRDVVGNHDPLEHAIAAHRAMGQFGLLFLLLGGGSTAWFRARERRRAAVLDEPKLQWMELVSRIEMRSDAALIGYAYEVRSASGRTHRISTPHKHPPVVDDRGRVLAVTPLSDPGALPFVVCSDGYPFLISKSSDPELLTARSSKVAPAPDRRRN